MKKYGRCTKRMGMPKKYGITAADLKKREKKIRDNLTAAQRRIANECDTPWREAGVRNAVHGPAATHSCSVRVYFVRDRNGNRVKREWRH